MAVVAISTFVRLAISHRVSFVTAGLLPDHGAFSPYVKVPCAL